MDQSKHTPAPWQFCEVMGKINAAGVRIADIPDYREGDELCTQEQKATGRLMASAPELLEALEGVFKLLPDYPPHDPNYYLVADMRKAMHKARGDA